MENRCRKPIIRMNRESRRESHMAGAGRNLAWRRKTFGRQKSRMCLSLSPLKWGKTLIIPDTIEKLNLTDDDIKARLKVLRKEIQIKRNT